jgi:transcriptional regulator GlxA family with amidase domain
MNRLNTGIFIFDGVEVLDLAGPFEVFSRARLVPGVESRRSDDSAPFTVFTVARFDESGARDRRITGAPALRLRRRASDRPGRHPWRVRYAPTPRRPRRSAWIQERARKARLTTSVCTGALLLAKAGLLSGKRATTHRGALDLLASLDPTIVVERQMRVVNDRIVTSAGVAAGIDMTLSVVESIHGKSVADETAPYIEFPRKTGKDERL